MRVLVFEPGSAGHRLTYVRQILLALKPIPGVEPVIALRTGTPGIDAYAHQIAPHIDPASVFEFGTDQQTRSKFERAGLKSRLFLEAVRETRPDHILVPSADGMAQNIALRPRPRALAEPVRAEFIMHRGSFAYPADTLRRRCARKLALLALARTPAQRILFVDVLAEQWLRERGHPLARRSAALADPVDRVEPIDKLLARDMLGVPRDGRLISTGGAQNTQKGVDWLVRAFARAHADAILRPSDRLLLAGRASEPVRAVIREEAAHLLEDGRLIHLDRYLSDEELHAALSAGDVVAVTHPAHIGLSNIALRTVAAGRPVVASDYGWLGVMVPRFGLGWNGPVTLNELIATVGRVAGRAAKLEHLPAQPGDVDSTFADLTRSCAGWGMSLGRRWRRVFESSGRRCW